MATSTIQGKIETYLAQRRNSLLGIQVAEDRQGAPASSRPDFVDRVYDVDGPQTPRTPPISKGCSATAGLAVRVSLYLARRPGHRALRRRELRQDPDYFDGGNIVKLAIEGGCKAVASTFACSVLSRASTHKILSS